MLKYQAGTQYQYCEYCDQKNDIADRQEHIKEYDLHCALQELAHAEPTQLTTKSHCNACGASFKFSGYFYVL